MSGPIAIDSYLAGSTCNVTPSEEETGDAPRRNGYCCRNGVINTADECSKTKFI